MKTRTSIGSLPRHVGELVRVCAFLKRIRDQKTVQFLILRNNTGLVQAVIEKNDANKTLNEIISSLTPESSLEVEGTVIANEKASLGGVEIQISAVRIANLAATPLPIDFSERFETNIDSRMDWRHLDLRSPENLLIFKIQTFAEAAMREFWLQEGFIEIHSPKILGTPSEGGAEVFEIKKYFEMPYACLAQSPQFYKQMAQASGFDRVFEIGPVFRADPSFTGRHCTQFTGVDMEMSWTESHHDVMAHEERWLTHVIKRVKETYGDAIKETFGVDLKVPQIPYPRVTMAEAVEIVRATGHEPAQSSSYVDLDHPGELILGKHVLEKTGCELVFLTDFPVSVRPFYQKRIEGNPTLTQSYDLLWNGLEITTGTQREHRYDVLLAQAKEKKLSQEPLQFYLDFFKYGCPPHGGFGLGLERLLMQLTGLKTIREASYLFRGPTRLTP
jgi:aspartyl-tRNA synthetase